ncbi:MAG: F0F1 ATP synthase subunit delta [Candidatus Sungbacteria bacterium]|nr:F0F1 ATP synthase subunit delta [bacterium]MDZ4260541.1 F0F1 ATP synthase subunit delta [Candidatus Sungbacteria bacterium]
MRFTNTQYAQAFYEVLKDTKGKNRTSLIQRFIGLLQAHKASSRIDRILEKFEAYSLDADGLIKVEVESAAPLLSETRRDIQSALKRKIFLDESVHPELLAGIKLIVNNEILIDATGRRRIDSLLICKSEV